MSLAPYFVLWVFAALAFAILVAGVTALVWPEAVAAVARRVDWGDLAAAWLAGAQVHYIVETVAGLDPRVWGDAEAWWAMGAGLAVWIVLRLAPHRYRRPSLLLGLALALWAFTIGAGQVFIGEMEADAAWLREAPAEVLAPYSRSPGSPLPTALARSERFDRLDESTRGLRDAVIATLARGEPLDQGVRAAALEQLVPPLIEHYRRDLIRLRTYQWIQIALLAVLLLAWGWGERISGRVHAGAVKPASRNR